MSCNEPIDARFSLAGFEIIAAACARAGIFAPVWFHPLGAGFAQRLVKDKEIELGRILEVCGYENNKLIQDFKLTD